MAKRTIVGFDSEAAFERSRQGTLKVEGAPTNQRTRRGRWGGNSDAECPGQDAEFVFTLFGPPTGGTWATGTWVVDGVSGSVTGLAYNITAATLQTALEGHGGIGAGNVLVAGGPGHQANFIVRFTGALSGKFIETPGLVYGSLTGTGVGALAYPTKIGR